LLGLLGWAPIGRRSHEFSLRPAGDNAAAVAAWLTQSHGPDKDHARTAQGNRVKKSVTKG
jgi:hypothetical protein